MQTIRGAVVSIGQARRVQSHEATQQAVSKTKGVEPAQTTGVVGVRDVSDSEFGRTERAKSQSGF